MKVAQYEIYVPYGKRQKVVLPDGTKVILNAGSYMKYPRQFGKEDRYVHFKGEAYFDVAKIKTVLSLFKVRIIKYVFWVLLLI